MNKPGLKLTREISLKVDWLKFSGSFLKSLQGGFKVFSGDVTGTADAIGGLLAGADTISKDIPVGSKAVEFIILCFAWAFDILRSTGTFDEDDSRIAAKTVIDNIKQRIETENIEIPFDFFYDPATAEPYLILRDEFIRHKAAFRPSKTEDSASLKYRFDHAFRQAVWMLWTKKSSELEELALALSSPAAKVLDFDRQWRSYRAGLVFAFDVAPVFGQEESRVSLGQLYVPLRCLWLERRETGRLPYIDDLDKSEDIYHVSSLEKELTEWIDNGSQHDWLRLVGGGPGSGKSTSAKAFAAKIALREDVRPLFVALQELPAEGILQERINRYFRDRSGSPFNLGPLERKNVESGPRLLLIFDGLDELARPGDSADEIARDLIDWVSDLRKELVGDTPVQHRVLITGRMPSFQAARRRANRSGKEALEVLGLLPVTVGLHQSIQGAAAPHARPQRSIPTVKGEERLREADDRERWWQKYAAATGRQAQPPKALHDERLTALTGEPLLCYLLALSGYLEANAEQAADNRNRIYERLLGDVWKRMWGGGRAGPGSDLQKQEFDILFEAMALAAWHGGDERVATYARFMNAIKVTQAENVYERFRTQEGADLSNLAVNFYLKRMDVESRGFEFTHKSFGEYLTARALIRRAVSVAKLARERLEFALDDWVRAT